MPTKPKVETFSITVDGREVEARKGEMVIAAAERGGTYIPRFCWHPRMKAVGMCRMCVVDIKGPRGWGLIPACYVPAAPGMEVNTQSPRVKKAQDGILEFLLINHPLDCPVCDQGGECPLQDHTLAFGPGETRMAEEKRHFEKPIPISDLVLLDRERCIMCARCTRFADEIAADPFIQIIDRGNGSQINVFPDHPFASYFSGNTVQICPVGALTSAPYRFKARPWDLDQVESTCTVCAVGCRIALQSQSNRLSRMLGLDSEPVNHGWLCDKGRFSVDAVNSENRLTTPLVRRDGQLVEATWGEALDAAASGLLSARDLHGADTIAVVGGARLANEDAYAWAKLAKGVLGTDNVDCQLGDGLPAEVVLGLPRATIEDAAWADTLVLLGPDVKEELPVLHLRLLAAARENRVAIVELSSRPSGLTPEAAASLRHQPGAAPTVVAALLAEAEPSEAVAGVAADLLQEARRLLDPSRSTVVVVGRGSLAESAEHTVQAALALHEARPAATFLPALRRGNVHGALELGLAPGVLPGATSLEDGASRFAEAWGSVPASRGMDTTGALVAASEGRLSGLVLLGADPLTDHPDRWLARRGLSGARFVVAVDAFRSASVEQADVVLPAAIFGERAGTTTNVEGRVSRLGQKVVPPGVAWADWMIASELAIALGADLGLESLAGIADEIERLAPSRAGVTRARIEASSHRDGLVVPLDRSDAPPTATGVEPNDGPEPGAVDRHVEASGAPSGVGDDTGGERASTPTATISRPAPPLLRPPAARVSPPPKADAYKLRLISSRTLYDRGAFTQESGALAKLAPEPALHVHPSDINRFSLADGAQVRVTSSRGVTTLPVVADPGLPRGACWLAFNVGGTGAADLIDAAEPVTDLAVESA